MPKPHVHTTVLHSPLPFYLMFPPNPTFPSTPHYSFYPLISLYALISPWLFLFFLRLPSRFPSNIICISLGNEEGIHQLDSSDQIWDLAPITNLDSQRDVGTIKYKLRSLEQSSWPCSSKSYVKAKLLDVVKLQSNGFRKHFKSSEIISKIVKSRE